MSAAADDPFVVAGLWAEDSQGNVSITFESEAGSHRAVTIPRPNIPSVISLLQSKIEAGSVTPINRHGLFVGQSFAMRSIRTIRHADGSAQLVLYVSLPDENNRGVTIPLDLTIADANDLVRALSPPPQTRRP